MRTGLLDSPVEDAFDRLTSLASRVISAPVALVSLVDRDRQFFKSAHGLGEPWVTRRETDLARSICQHVVATGEALVIGDLREHPVLRTSLALPDLGVVAYAGIPLRLRNGEVLGSFCVIDAVPRAWRPEELELLRDLAACVMTEIELRLATRARDELASLVAHDLQTPLGGVLLNCERVARHLATDAVGARIADLAARSAREASALCRSYGDYLRLEAGTLDLQPRPRAVDELLRRALRLVLAEAECAEGDVRIDLAPSPGLYARCDLEATVRAVRAFFDAAVRTRRAGEVIRVEAGAREGAVWIEWKHLPNGTGAGTVLDPARDAANERAAGDRAAAEPLDLLELEPGGGPAAEAGYARILSAGSRAGLRCSREVLRAQGGEGVAGVAAGGQVRLAVRLPVA